jgi:hypothetical protein
MRHYAYIAALSTTLLAATLAGQAAEERPVSVLETGRQGRCTWALLSFYLLLGVPLEAFRCAH